VCADSTCTAPSAGELGELVGAKNTAVNLNPDVIQVTNTGGGTVTGASGKINCRNGCAAFSPNGSSVTVTAKANSGNVFTGWSGACVGTQANCTVTVNGVTVVTASFAPVVPGGGGGGGGGGAGTPSYTLSIGRSNPGTVTSDLIGINCGNACSAKFVSGTIVTLTATPPAGKTFASWGGGCSGTAPTCSLNLIKDTSVQANFNK